MSEIPAKKFQMLPLPIGEEWEALKDVSCDYATIVTVPHGTYVVCPFRSTGLGAHRCHFSTQPLPDTAYRWRREGVTYVAFRYNNQKIISIYVSNSGIARVQIIENGKAIRSDVQYSPSSAIEMVEEGMVEISQWQ